MSNKDKKLSNNDKKITITLKLIHPIRNYKKEKEFSIYCGGKMIL